VRIPILQGNHRSIAGIYYGYESIPQEWLNVLVRKDDIEMLCKKLDNKYMAD
jgi:ADP-ribosylglycohydrolase